MYAGTVESSAEVNDINQKIWFELHNNSTIMEPTTIVISSTDNSSPETTPSNIDRHNASEHIDASDTLGEFSSNRKLGKGKGPVNKRFKRKGQQHVIVDLTLSPNTSEQGLSTNKLDAVHEHELIPVEERVHAVCDDGSAETSTKFPECGLTKDGNARDSFVECKQQQTTASPDKEVYSTDRKLATKLLHDASNIHSYSTEILKAELVSIDKELKAVKQILMNAVLGKRADRRDT